MPNHHADYRGLAWCLAGLAVTAWADDPGWVLPHGTTQLTELVEYRVGFRQNGNEQWMPASWSGQFSTPARIAVVPTDHVMDRDAIMVHPPWGGGTGPIWIDYQLRLPAGVPARLEFAMGMRDRELGPGSSDGVTFTCQLVGRPDGPQTLFTEHYRQAGWKHVVVDLSDAAGAGVVLRLLVDPGPAQDSTSDTAFLGEPRIVCGVTEADQSQPGVPHLIAAANELAAEAGLGRLVNDPSGGVLPGNAVPHQTRIERIPDGHALVYEGADGRVVWTYRPTTGTLDDLQVQFGDEEPIRPAGGGGAFTSEDETDRRLEGGEPRLVNVGPDGLQVTWVYPQAGDPVEVEWGFRLHGKALVVNARSHSREISALSLGDTRGPPLRRRIPMPYLHRVVDYLPAEQLFALRFFDWTQSHASRSPEHVAEYSATTAGERNCLQEVGCIAVSRNLYEVLPNIPHPPSPYRNRLASLIVLDLWGHVGGTYAGDTEHLLNLKDQGIDHLAVILHDWQRYGYDVKLPDHLPADPRYGTEADLATFGTTATRLGYPWAVHENYIDIYPDAPSWDPEAVVLEADGSRSKAWFNPGTGVQSYGIKCNRALGFAERVAPEAHRRYGTTAGYLDVHTGVPPWHQLDYDATQPLAAMALHKVQRDAELFAYLRATHEGPLFGEGHKVLYWAGLFDAAEAQVEGGEDHAPLLDFELLKIHPQVVNHGMGYYERWYRAGWNARWGIDAGTPEELDKYRAQQIAYGHAGFVGRHFNADLTFIAQEHHLMHPIQRLMAAARPTAIDYWIDGDWVSASVAVAVGVRDRQRIRYDSGLTVWVNWRAAPWLVEGRRLPQWGFLALGPETEAWTALVDSRTADFAACPEFVYADARMRGESAATTDREAPASVNSAGRHFDYGGIRTDGAIKVERGGTGLVVIPYPREGAFSVTLDLDRLGASLPVTGPVTVVAVEARTGRRLAEIPSTQSGTQITFQTGTPRAGRYRIEVGP